MRLGKSLHEQEGALRSPCGITKVVGDVKAPQVDHRTNRDAPPFKLFEQLEVVGTAGRIDLAWVR